MSSISKPHLERGSLRKLGAEIRRRRLELHLSQAEAGRPFTRAYVSAIESGQCAPSLGALLHLAQRLGTTAPQILGSVNLQLADVYTSSHEGETSDRRAR